MLVKPILNFTAKYTENIIGIGVRNYVKPKTIANLKYAPELARDTLQILNETPLTKTFIQSLRKVKGKDKVDTLRLIKDSVLRKMGYKHPELLKLKSDSIEFTLAEKLGAAGGYSSELGNIYLSQKVLNLTQEQQIAFLYHELDHMDKYVKLYKSVGENKFQAAIDKSRQNNTFLKNLLGIKEDLKSDINLDFYRKMSSDIDISKFNSHKWHKAVQEYHPISPKLTEQYKYFNNPLEISAYGAEAIVKSALGLPSKTARDLFPKNFKSMVNKLSAQGIKNADEQEEIFARISPVAFWKNIDNKTGQIYLKSINGLEVTPDETKYMDEMINKISGDKKYSSAEFTQQVWRQVESFIDRRILTPEALMAHFGK